MRCLKGICLLCSFILFSQAEAVDSDPVEFPLAQSYLRHQPNINAYIRALRDRLQLLQQRNAELQKQVEGLESYCQLATTLQKQLEDTQQEFSALYGQNQNLQSQLKLTEAELQAFKIQQARDALELKRGNELLAICQREHQQIETLTQQQNQNALDLERTQQQLQVYEQKQKQSQEVLQTSGTEIKALTEDFQKLQAAYDSTKQKLLDAENRVEQLTRGAKDSAWFDQQILAKNKKIGELNATVSELNKRNYELNQAKTICEDQLQANTKRQAASDKSRLQALKEAQEKEVQLQAVIQEKTDLITNWRQEYDKLKSVLDKAISINNELRQQLNLKQPQ